MKINSLHAVIFLDLICIVCRIFSKLTFSKIISGIPAKCQRAWIQIRPDRQSPNCLQKSYQQTTLAYAELSLQSNYIDNASVVMIRKCQVHTMDRRQSKTIFIIRDERELKLLETVFSIVICRQPDNKWQSKTMFLTIFE